MRLKAISIVRSFSRAVTLRVGLFTDRFLGRDRPLREARLIFEIGHDGAEVRALRARLDLDSSYLSRLLHSLERQGLAEVVPLETDRRIRQVFLTEDGKRELNELNQRGDGFAETILKPLSEAEQHRLVTAMCEVEQLLSLAFADITVEDPTSHEAKTSFDHYLTEVTERCADSLADPPADVQSITANIRKLKPPQGTFLVVRLDGEPVGCGAVEAVSSPKGSIQSLWVDRSVRGLGIGKRLLLALEEEAAMLGLDALRLEVPEPLDEAVKLVRRNGYREIDAADDASQRALCFKKNLAGAPPC